VGNQLDSRTQFGWFLELTKKLLHALDTL
jgi:hypothetical protein